MQSGGITWYCGGPYRMRSAECGVRKKEYDLYNQTLTRLTIDHYSFERMLSEAKCRACLGTECGMRSAEEGMDSISSDADAMNLNI